VKVAHESVLSNRGNLEGTHLTRFSPGGGYLRTPHCTVENCLQLLQILIVSLLPLHINNVGVVTCSDDSTRRLVTCIIGFFFNSFHYHVTQFHCCNVSITIQEKN